MLPIVQEKQKKMSWKTWGTELNEYLKMLDFYLSPDRFIIGGG